MHKMKEINKRIIIMFFMIVCAVAAMFFCKNRIAKELSQEMKNSMQLVAEQNETGLRREFLAQYNLLETIATEVGRKEKSPKKIIDDLQDVVDIYNFKRIGYVDAQGTVYTTDGFHQDLSYRDFYRDGMRGQVSITEVLEDSLGEHERINVFSVPVYEEKSHDIMGVLFMTFRNSRLREIIDYNCFNGNGTTYVFNQDEEMIVASEDTDVASKKSLLEGVREQISKDKNYVKKVDSDDQAGAHEFGSSENDSKQYFCCTALNLMQDSGPVYVLTIVPEKYLTQLEKPFISTMNYLLAIVVMLIIIGGVGFVLLQYRKEKEIRRRLCVDKVTGGDNLAAFAEKLAKYKGHSGYAVSMDLDDFKLINDTFGISKGDEVICEIWKIITAHLKRDELAAHTNADNFLIFLQGDNQDQVEKRIKEMSEEIYMLSVQLNVPHIVPAFGISYIHKLEERDWEYGKANTAKSQIKGRRDLFYAFFDQKSSQRIQEEKSLEDDFQQSIEDERFELWYQPKVVQGGEVIHAAEALVRWRDNKGKLISPGKFIPLFERNGMISILDEYVFEHVCMQQREWLDMNMNLVPVSVNISRASLYFDDIVERYTAIVKKYGIDPKMIQLEITESAMMENDEVEELIEKFQKQGFEMHMDDFGNGYSSMALLSKTKFDVLKLDKSLIDGIGDTSGELLLESLTGLAKKLGLSIVAEGVETKEQAAFIWNHSCDAIQGYYYYKPMQVEEFEDLLN